MSNILSFNERFDAIVCLGGLIPEISFFNYFEAKENNCLFDRSLDKSLDENLKENLKQLSIPLIAADGAINSLVDINILPSHLIGDIDSTNLDILKANSKNLHFFHISEQDTNDFEKCLKFVKLNNFQNILIIGFNGGLLEHVLNNWSVLAKYADQLNMCIYEHNRYAFVLSENIQEKIHFEFKQKETISLIPQCKVRLESENFVWDLKNEELEIGVREGARNIAKEENISIKIISGSLLLFCDARLPFAPVIK
jgi:thiamine pyrophosphokinase